MSITEKTISIDGREVHYLEAGRSEAPPMILLQGNVGDAIFHWQKMMPELAIDYHVVAPDLPGFGDSEPLSRTTFEALVNWLDAFVSALELETATVVGTSVGGLIARLFAAQHPQKVSTLVLVNGGSLPATSPLMARILARIPLVNNLIFGSTSRQMVASREALNWLALPPEVVTENLNYAPPDVMTDEMLSRAQANTAGLTRMMKTQVLSPVPEATTPTVPTLILWGENDDVSPLSVGKLIQSVIPDSTFISIADTQHAPHISEPDIVAFQIERYIEELNKPDKPDFGGVGILGG